MITKNPRKKQASVTIQAMNTLSVIPPTIDPISAHAAVKNAYGICVVTCSRCGHPEPVEERIVVSLIGDAWSPNTAPPSTDEMQMRVALRRASA